MTHRHFATLLLGCAAIAGFEAAMPLNARVLETPAPRLAIGHVSISGTSNIHAYTATSTAARVVQLQVAAAAREGSGNDLLQPGAIEQLEIAIPAASLSSPKEGLDKNMHKALKVDRFPEITFRLRRLELAETAHAYLAFGLLTVAGVEREIALALKTRGEDGRLVVGGEAQLLMTDFGIAPPKAMLGMLKTDPKVTVSFEATLLTSLT